MCFLLSLLKHCRCTFFSILSLFCTIFHGAGQCSVAIVFKFFVFEINKSNQIKSIKMSCSQTELFSMTPSLPHDIYHFSDVKVCQFCIFFNANMNNVEGKSCWINENIQNYTYFIQLFERNGIKSPGIENQLVTDIYIHAKCFVAAPQVNTANQSDASGTRKTDLFHSALNNHFTP